MALPVTCSKCGQDFWAPGVRIDVGCSGTLVNSTAKCPFCGHVCVTDGTYINTGSDVKRELITSSASKSQFSYDELLLKSRLERTVLELRNAKLKPTELREFSALLIERYKDGITDKQLEVRSGSINPKLSQVVHNVRRHKGILGTLAICLVLGLKACNFHTDIHIDLAQIIESIRGKSQIQVLSEVSSSPGYSSETKVENTHPHKSRGNTNPPGHRPNGKGHDIAHE